MGEMVERKLLDIGCNFISGFGFKSSDFEDKGIPLIKIGNIKNRIITIDDKGSFISETIVNDKIQQVFLSNNDVLIAMTGQGSVGRVGRLKLYKNNKALLNQRVGKFICDEKNINLDYLYYILTSDKYQDYLFNTGAGSGQPNLSPNLILHTKIPWCPYPEQKAIAEVLCSLDDKIDLLHRQNKTLEQMAETLFRQWFVEEAKEDWSWHQLGDFIEVVRGLSYKGAGLTEKGNGIPMHNLNSILEGGGYKYSGIKYYSGEYKERHLILPGDLIITNTEQGHDMLLIGYPAIVPEYYGKLGIFSQHLYKLKLKNDCLAIFFLNYLLMSYDIREQITGATNGSTVNMLAKDGIEWVKFKLPPKYKIDLFTETVKPMLKKKETNYSDIRTLEKLRDTLLPKLMNGEVRVAL